MRLIDILIETTEILCSAIQAKNGDKAFEAVTSLFMQVLDLCVHVEGTFEIMFPLLEQLKDKIKAVDFEGAERDAFALLTKFRTLRELASIKGDRLPG
jgi:hypothetical protein